MVPTCTLDIGRAAIRRSGHCDIVLDRSTDEQMEALTCRRQRRPPAPAELPPPTSAILAGTESRLDRRSLTRTTPLPSNAARLRISGRRYRAPDATELPPARAAAGGRQGRGPAARPSSLGERPSTGPRFRPSNLSAWLRARPARAWPEMPVVEAEIILDPHRRAGLSAGGSLFEDKADNPSDAA